MDYAATTFIKDKVIDEMLPFMTGNYGNPSSMYSLSSISKMAIDESRKKLANAINCNREEIFFTGNGTEADNWAIKGYALANREKGNHIITSCIEHHAVLHSCEYLEKHGFEVSYLQVDKEGSINLDELKAAIKENTILVSIMTANNEIGTIEPISSIGSICREKGILFHTDAVQAAGHIKLDVQNMNVDMLSISGHKFYGPKGIGALYIRKGVKIDSILHGGAQERGRRAGTENISGIVGMGKAIELSMNELESEKLRLTYLRDSFIEKLLNIKGAFLNGPIGEKRLAGNINVGFTGIDGELLLMMLDEKGICASSGSACAAGAIDPSHVLLSIGLSKEAAKSSIRLTIGSKTTKEEIDYVAALINELTLKLRNIF
jgi:cysteine desulfurase